MVIRAWSRMVRLPNLLMIVFIQLFIYASFIRPYIPFEELALNKIQWILFLITLLCVAASGYVINNICDAQIDSLDSKKVIIPNYFSTKQSWQLYALLIFVGLISAMYLSFVTKFHYSFSMFPIAVGSLWLYSYKLKCIPLIGNILVSLMTGFVIAIIPFIFWDNLHELRRSDYEIWASLMYRFIMLFIFAFLSNLTREIVKDIEDIELDKNFNCFSTANYFGIPSSKLISLNVWFALVIICGSAMWHLEGLYPTLWCFLILGIPALYILILLIRANEKNEFTTLSLYIKLFMIIGVMYWCVVA